MSKKKFLFYFAGKPVYEGDEIDIILKKAVKEANGNLIELAKKENKKIEKFLKL